MIHSDWKRNMMELHRQSQGDKTRSEHDQNTWLDMQIGMILLRLSGMLQGLLCRWDLGPSQQV